MARLRNRVTGVVVTVADEKVDRLGTDFEPAEEKKPAARKSSSSKSE